MKEAIVTYRMGDGSVLHTLDELEEYGRTHEFPEQAQFLIQRMCFPEESFAG